MLQKSFTNFIWINIILLQLGDLWLDCFGWVKYLLWRLVLGIWSLFTIIFMCSCKSLFLGLVCVVGVDTNPPLLLLMSPISFWPLNLGLYLYVWILLSGGILAKPDEVQIGGGTLPLVKVFAVWKIFLFSSIQFVLLIFIALFIC